jgi:hypothetical protein
MEPINRRSFLKRSSVVLAATGAAAVLPSQFAAAAMRTPKSDAVEHNAAGFTLIPEESGYASPEGTFIAQVRNFASGEIALFSGEQEIVLHDRDLASRLARASKGGR